MITINGIRVGANGIRHAGKYIPVWVSTNTLVSGLEIAEIRCKSVCDNLPTELGPIKNGTDTQVDHFEKDRVQYAKGTAEYNLIAGLVEERNAARTARRQKKEQTSLQHRAML